MVEHPKPTRAPSATARHADLRKGEFVAEALAREHGRWPDLGNKTDPLDELVYISLTRQTHEKNAARQWDALISAYPTWGMLLEASEEEIAELIADGGFSRQKARWIKQSLRLIKETRGSLSLDFLEDLDDGEAERFLCTLPGINVKSAKCVLMYSLERDVLPVDTHVRRVSERLGLLEPNLTSRRAHERLEATVSPQHRFAYHVGAVEHGRRVCTVARPRCGECVLKHSCDYYDATSGAT
ncbi:MAG: endonuclease III [Actinomycetota bacterium]|nr:endonuclease III [Actinomycetota bacterium]